MKVDKGVPMPDKQIGRPPRYPFEDMDIGDSFEFERDDKQKISSAVSHYSKRKKKVFTIRMIKNKYRCFRIK